MRKKKSPQLTAKIEINLMNFSISIERGVYNSSAF
jgi:hypothetical protein